MITPGLAPFLALTVAFAAMLSVLGLRVSLRRFVLPNSTMGDCGDENLLRRIRAHGNFAEYAPVMLVTVLALHLAGFGPGVGWAAAGAFFVARLAHALSMPDDARVPLRIFAMVLQHTSFALAAAALVAALI
jgi:uncharacterized membrane protein YecN with MAPEG domain